VKGAVPLFEIRGRAIARVIHRGQVLAAILDPVDRSADMLGGKRDQEVLRIELEAGELGIHYN
jgi:hypothetical protein